MTNTENTITRAALATELENDYGVESGLNTVDAAAFMLGIEIGWVGSFPRYYCRQFFTCVGADRIREWVAGNGGQDVDGGVY